MSVLKMNFYRLNYTFLIKLNTVGFYLFNSSNETRFLAQLTSAANAESSGTGPGS